MNKKKNAFSSCSRLYFVLDSKKRQIVCYLEIFQIVMLRG